MMTKAYELLAIAPSHFSKYVEAEAAMAAKIVSMSAADLMAMSSSEDDEEDSYILQMVDKVAIVNVRGRLTNSDSWLNRYFGAVSYNEIRKASFQAVEHGAQAALYLIDSPGGAVSGMAEAGNMIANLGVPTISFTSSNMMSAAYFLGIQADHVFADSFADVGSVGVIMKMYDRSKMLSDVGIKPLRFRSGNLKAVGDGDFKLSKEEADYIQARVRTYADKFYRIVSDARGMSVDSMDKLGITSGRTYIGEEALAVNLIDGIKTFDESMLKAFELAKKVDKNPNNSLF